MAASLKEGRPLLNAAKGGKAKALVEIAVLEPNRALVAAKLLGREREGIETLAQLPKALNPDNKVLEAKEATRGLKLEAKKDPLTEVTGALSPIKLELRLKPKEVSAGIKEVNHALDNIEGRLNKALDKLLAVKETLKICELTAELKRLTLEGAIDKADIPADKLKAELAARVDHKETGTRLEEPNKLREMPPIDKMLLKIALDTLSGTALKSKELLAKRAELTANSPIPKLGRRELMSGKDNKLELVKATAKGAEEKAKTLALAALLGAKGSSSRRKEDNTPAKANIPALAELGTKAKELEEKVKGMLKVAMPTEDKEAILKLVTPLAAVKEAGRLPSKL